MSSQLVNQLTELVEQNIISAETADNIRQYLQAKKTKPSNRFGVILGILGALLIGSGIILIIAHNWDSFGRLLQTFLGLLPLALAQLLCVYTLVKKKEEQVWKESAATLLFFGIGTSIAVTSQVYHVDGTLTAFLLSWILLGFPLLYIFSSAGLSVILIGFIT